MAHEELSELGRSFPTLAGADGLAPFDAEALDAWACGTKPGAGAVHAARFVLSVYNAQAPWKCGPLEIVRALGVWDRAHREAFLAWAREPWTA